jgi:hypothetical protein
MLASHGTHTHAHATQDTNRVKNELHKAKIQVSQASQVSKGGNGRVRQTHVALQAEAAQMGQATAEFK